MPISCVPSTAAIPLGSIERFMVMTPLPCPPVYASIRDLCTRQSRERRRVGTASATGAGGRHDHGLDRRHGGVETPRRGAIFTLSSLRTDSILSQEGSCLGRRAVILSSAESVNSVFPPTIFSPFLFMRLLFRPSSRSHPPPYWSQFSLALPSARECFRFVHVTYVKLVSNDHYCIRGG